MKKSRSLESAEYVYGTRRSGEALGQFVFTNMPPEAEQAIDDRVITPTTTDFVRLMGIEIDGLPALSVSDLIGPTAIGDLDTGHQAFYFSGPNHPVLLKARQLPTFVTYRDILDIHGNLGIRRETATKNFKGLVRSIFEDDAVSTFGEPREYQFEGTDAGGFHMLHRFAVRRKIAQMAMTGEYGVGISGTHDANMFNGYGRALIRAIYDVDESRRRMELTMELESIPDLVVDSEDVRCFQWGKIYRDSEGVGYKMNAYDYQGVVYKYIRGLLAEIGAASAKEGWTQVNVSEQAFVAAIDALCLLDNSHKKAVQAGHACTQGLHCKGLTRAAVQRAKSIAACVTEADADTGNFTENDVDEEINLLDSGFQAT